MRPMLAVETPKPALRARDAARSKQEILRAAVDEFAHAGLAGARMDGIAERANVDKRLLYYYFGGKENLFLAALEQTYGEIREAERALRLEQMAPADAVRTLVAFTWQYYLAHPEFLALLNNENLHRAEHLRRSPRIREANSPLVALLAQVIERGVAAGVFRAGVDALQLYISIASLAYFYLSNRHTLTASFGRELMSARALDDRLAHITEVVMAYVQAPPKRRTTR